MEAEVIDRDGTVLELTKRVEDLSDRVALAKVHFIGQEDNQPSNVKPVELRNTDERIFSKSGALAPPYGPDILCKIFEHSSSLRQNVDAYAVNIDANGHRFEPVIDLEADDAFDQVRDAMFLERLHEAERDSGGDAVEIEAPTDAEVDERMTSMTEEMRLEKAKLEAFFKFCCADESFVSLRQKTRTDQEVIGGGFWEIIRNGAGEPSQFTYIPAFTMRLLPLKRSDLVETETNIKVSPLTFDKVRTRKRFRRYVQVFEGSKSFFKSFGDPRVMSVETGALFKTDEALQSAEAEGRDEADGPVPAATEVIYFPIHSPRSPYGIPRWIGNLLAVLGTRQAEEVNFLYFENKSVPPLAILVSGGRMSSDSVKRLETYVENKIKGRKNFHRILVIEAEPAGGQAAPIADNVSGRMRIEIVPLTGSQQSDALFLKYDERNADKVGMSFRLPRLLRGDIRDFNRATAEAALEFAEAQVFGPLREDFDWTINRKILAELEVKFWTFASNSPTTSNPIDLAKIIADLVLASVLTPEEGRELAKSVFNRDFAKIDELWTKIPPDLLKAGILPEGEELPGQPVPDSAKPAPTDGDEEEEEEELQRAAGDVGTGDLRTGGGAKVPAQGKPKKKPKKKKPGFTRLPAGIGKRYADRVREKNMRKLAKDVLELRRALDAEERRIAADEDLALRKADLEENGPVEYLRIPATELEALFAD